MQFVPLFYENLPGAPSAEEHLADRDYDGNRFHTGLLERGIVPFIPSTRSRKVAVPYRKTFYCRWHRIESVLSLPAMAPHRRPS